MNRRVRIGIIIAVIGVILVVGGVYVLNRVVIQSLAPPPPPTPRPITARAVITTHDVAMGTILRAEDVTILEIPVGIAPWNALSEVGDALGRITKVPLVGGEMVLEHHLADPTNVSHDLAFIIGDDQVQMAFPATDLMSTLNILQPGDVVDILVSIDKQVPVVEAGRERTTPEGEQQQEARLFTFDALQAIQIQAIVVDVVTQSRGGGVSASVGGEAQPTPTPQPSEIQVRAYLLALSPQDALVLKNLRDDGGRFDIVLRSPTSTQLFELSPVFSEYLIDRYELTIEEVGR